MDRATFFFSLYSRYSSYQMERLDVYFSVCEQTRQFHFGSEWEDVVLIERQAVYSKVGVSAGLIKCDKPSDFWKLEAVSQKSATLHFAFYTKRN